MGLEHRIRYLTGDFPCKSPRGCIGLLRGHDLANIEPYAPASPSSRQQEAKARGEWPQLFRCLLSAFLSSPPPPSLRLASLPGACLRAPSSSRPPSGTPGSPRPLRRSRVEGAQNPSTRPRVAPPPLPVLRPKPLPAQQSAVSRVCIPITLAGVRFPQGVRVRGCTRRGLVRQCMANYLIAPLLLLELVKGVCILGACQTSIRPRLLQLLYRPLPSSLLPSAEKGSD